MQLTDADWQSRLTPEQYRVLRQKGTEVPFTGELLQNKQSGMYDCAACGAELFSSETKFESGSGWPSFTDVTKSDAVELSDDSSDGMQRIEVKCSKCSGHLGHLFDDGPTENGQRYCINSVCLTFKPRVKQV